MAFRTETYNIFGLKISEYSRDPNKRTGGNRRTGKKLDQELINVQEVINVQGKITSNLFFSLIGKVSDIFRT